MSSVRFPSVALSRPPTASPVFAATDSVAWLNSAASGTMARTDSTKSSVCAPSASLSAARTAGTNTSSQSSGLWRMSCNSGFIRAPLSGALRWTSYLPSAFRYTA